MKEAVHEVKHAVGDKLGAQAGALKDKGADTVNHATDTAGASLSQVAQQLRQAAEGLGENQAWADQAFRQGAEGIDRVAGYLTNGRFDDFARDLQRFAGSNPVAFLAGSVAVGFIAARVARAAAEQAAETAEPTPPSNSYASATAPNPYEESRSFAATGGNAGYASPGAL